MTKFKKVMITLPPAIHTAGTAFARSKGVSFSALVADLITYALADAEDQVAERLDDETQRRGYGQPGAPFTDVRELIAVAAGETGDPSIGAIETWLPRFEREPLAGG